MDMSIYISPLAVLALSVIIVTIPYWPLFQRQGHPPILSVSAGVGITYVFLAVLPKMAMVQASLAGTVGEGSILTVERHVYLGALAGFVIFLFIANKGFSERSQVPGSKLTLGEIVVLSVFSMYFAQIGFLLGEWPSESLLGYFALTCAIGMHFIGINYHLWKRYPCRYSRLFRWFFSCSLIIGWVGAGFAEQVGGFVKLSSMFVAGGIIITAIREEIPSQGESNIFYFLTSVAVTTAFILFAEVVLLK
ncbi:hypothetical protein [Microbulbifer agarilyticus]|uniref:hypothetical protein n=1 Tax=Microbulbifer agarilyticus TaxID=260552 RepID=UPI001CD7EA2E|nr:hypothetical protein [Microbulbifer agarilyticus]MCA0901501.1 hypothetical protein [Microbulbifer agarilyticus]